LAVLFFFNDTATTEIYTLSLHDALPILELWLRRSVITSLSCGFVGKNLSLDRKSTRLNSSHTVISYAVLCLKKKTEDAHTRQTSSSPSHSSPTPHTRQP